MKRKNSNIETDKLMKETRWAGEHSLSDMINNDAHATFVLVASNKITRLFFKVCGRVV